MTPQLRQRLPYAPELAALHVLRTAADATRAAFEAVHPFVDLEPSSREQLLASRLLAVITRLERAADAYCNYIVDLPQAGFVASDDCPF